MARFTLDTDAQFDQSLAELMQQTGGTKADVIRRALATYQYLKKEIGNTGGGPPNKVSIRDAAGNVKADVILP